MCTRPSARTDGREAFGTVAVPCRRGAMELRLALIILVGLPEILSNSVVLVTPKDGSERSLDSPDAICCSLACPTCTKIETSHFYDKSTDERPICRCDPLCINYGDCCPGYSDRCPFGSSGRSARHHSDTRVKLECVRTSDEETRLYQDKHGFFMVSSCLGSTDWGAIGELCQAHPNFTKISMRELNASMETLPVGSNLTGLHYKNIYCALCNGVPADSLIPWVAWSNTEINQSAEAYARHWFDPPSTPPVANVTHPRSCITGVIVSNPASQNTSMAKVCSGVSNYLDAGQCWFCDQMINRCLFFFSEQEVTFKIPFNFPSFVERTVKRYTRPVSCPDRFFFDLERRRCARLAGRRDKVPATDASLCKPWHRELNTIWMRLQVSNLRDASSKEVLREDVRSAFLGFPDTTPPSVAFLSTQRDWNLLNSHPEYQSRDNFDETNKVNSIALKVHFSGQARVGLNISGEISLSAAAEDLLARQANRSYRVSGVEYLLPCGNYTIDRCVADLADVVDIDSDEMTMNGAFSHNASYSMVQSDKLLRRISHFSGNNTHHGSAFSNTSQLFLCTSKDRYRFEHVQKLLYVIGTVVSLVGLLLTFITYSILPGLRSVPGIGTMNLVAATFSAQLGLLLTGQLASTVHPALCTALAVLLHYVWLASFLWTSCLALGLSRTLGNPTGTRRRPHRKAQTTKLNALYGWGGPAPIVATCLIIHFVGHQNGAVLVYGAENTCWIQPKEANLVAFGVPVMASLLANVGMFVKAVRGIRASKKATKCLKTHVPFFQRARLELTIYVKVSILMGFSWLWAFLGAFTDIEEFWFAYVICNSFQGAYIFVAFVCTTRVLHMLRTRLRGRRDQSPSTGQTVSRLATFHRMTQVPPASNKNSSSLGP